MPRWTKTREERFWDKVQKTDTCWNWTAGMSGCGYGHFRDLNNRQRDAHCVSYEMAYGTIPVGLQVLHECDNKACVRPDHLIAGTRSKNMQDMHARGLAGYTGSPGSLNPKAKLTPEMVFEIRHIGLDPHTSRAAIGRKFGVSGATVSKIILRKTWQHI